MYVEDKTKNETDRKSLYVSFVHVIVNPCN